MASNCLIYGIDPGIATCGIARYEPADDVVTLAQTLRTYPRDGDDSARLRKMALQLSLFLVAPEDAEVVVAIEEQHARRGRWAAKFAADTMRGPAAVRGVVIALAMARDWEVVGVQPAAANRALTGNASASAAQMKLMAQARYGVDRTGHVADAIGFALAADAELRLRHAQEVGEGL